MDLTDKDLTMHFDKNVFSRLETLTENTDGGILVLSVDSNFRIRSLYLGKGCYKNLLISNADLLRYSSDIIGFVLEEDKEQVLSAVKKAVSSDDIIDCFFRAPSEGGDMGYFYGKAMRVPYEKSQSTLLLVSIVKLSRKASEKCPLSFEDTELIGRINENAALFTIKNDEELTLISCNGTYCKLHGLSNKTDLFANNCEKTAYFITAESLETLRQLINDAIVTNRKQLSCDIRLHTFSGEERDLFFLAFLFVENGEYYLTVCATDNSEQTSIRENFHSVFNSLNGGFIIWQIKDGMSLSPLLISDGFEKMLGVDKETLLEKFTADAFSYVHPEDLPKLQHFMRQNVRDRKHVKTSIRLQKYDGSYIWMNVNLFLKSDGALRNTIYASYMDITDLKTAERELSMREAAYTIAAAQSGKAVARYDIKKKILYLQECHEVNFYPTLTEKDVPNNAVSRGIVANGSVNDYLEFYKNMEMGIPSGNATICMLNLTSGKQEWYHGEYSLLFDEDNSPKYSIISYTNIDREYRAMLERQRRNNAVNEKKLMLIVDDVEVNRIILKEMFADEFSIIEAVDGEDALEKIALYGDRLSIILLDIIMPKKDGLAVLREMQEHPEWAGITTVVVSSTSEAEYGLDIIKLGAVEFLSKAANPSVFKLRVNSALIRREAERLRIENLLLIAGKREDEKHAKELRHLAEIDRLTGLLNRTAFVGAAREILRNVAPFEYILCAVDMDNFKILNDLYGYEEGDKVLAYMAEKIKAPVEKIGGICCRTAADNFIYLMKNEPDIFANNPNEIKIPLFEDYPLAFRFVVRVGRYVITDPSVPVDAMIDRALMAKRSIKGVYQRYQAYYNEEMRETLLKQQTLSADADEALKNEEFIIFLQPKYSISTKKIVGAESLVRWPHPTRGFLMPSSFIPVFERSGLIVKLDEFIIDRTAAIIRKWIDEDKVVVPVSVNLSRMNIYNPRLVKTLCDTVNKYNIPPRLLELELTESAFVQNPKQFISTVKELRRLGFIVQMDDFGSGYSSLSALRDIDVDVVKLDIRFLPPDSGDVKGKSILSTVVSLAKLLNLDLIAEGVETAHQVEYLKSIGCDTVQGYFFAKPMPIADFERTIYKTHNF